MATGYSASTASTVSNASDLYEKTNTDVKTAIKLVVEEYKWFRQYPRENITVSGNENRVPIVLTAPNMPAAIPDGGAERIMITNMPTHGTFMPTQLNVRFGYTGLAQALDSRARGSQIESQTGYQSMMGVYSLARGIGLQTYGQSTATVAVIKTTQSAGTVQVLPLKNAYGSSTFCAGGDLGPQDTYLSNIFAVNDRIALFNGASIRDFGTVTASPSATSGIGYVDVTFASSITPTANDLVVFAMADNDPTSAGTDINNWTIGFTEALTASSVMGVTTASYAKWAAGSTQSSNQRGSFQVKEKMINECWNNGGVRINRFIIGQGVRRDIIASERSARRYDSGDVDINGDLEADDGEQYFTSVLALPGTMIGYYDQAYSQIMLSDLPDEGSQSKSMFRMDKVQAKSQIAASLDFFWAKIPSNRAGMGYASNLTSQ